jgi:hypothetical protein
MPPLKTLKKLQGQAKFRGRRLSIAARRLKNAAWA